MAKIIPFKGVRYDEAKVGSLASIITPPYDIIDGAAQIRYYNESPFNVIRLEFGQTFPTDNDTDNRYSRAAVDFSKWLNEGILVHEDKPALYLYEQEFNHRGKKLVRSGFICGVRVEDYASGVVLPHEQTLSKPKSDRLNLLRACKANFSSIFSLYADETRSVERLLNKAREGRSPEIDIKDEAGEGHRLWVISDEAIVREISALMADKKIFIADGHHRYETSLNYSKEMAQLGMDNYNHVMMTLVNLYDEGLVVFPTHRLVRDLTNLNLKALLEALAQEFSVEQYPFTNPSDLDNFMALLEDKGSAAHALGLYGGNQTLYILTLKDEGSLTNIGGPEKSEAWKHLDVSVLHSLILEKLLAIDEENQRNQVNLTYIKYPEAAVEGVNKGEHQLAFFLNPTKVKEVTDVAAAGDKMPQKSTYFYPKTITGLVINHLEVK